MERTQNAMEGTNTILDDVCAEIGYSATNVIVAWYGGDYVRVPVEVSAENPITRAIGMSAMRRFVQAWGGQRLWIPEAHRFTVEQRDRVIADLLKTGLKEREIGEAIGLSERRVQQIRARLTRDGLLELRGQKLEGKDAAKSALAKVAWKKPQAKTAGKSARKKYPEKVPDEVGAAHLAQSELGSALADAWRKKGS